MTEWVATAYGALDLSTHRLADEGLELVVTPTRAAEPRFLVGEGAELWRRLAEGRATSEELDEPSTRSLLDEMAEAGFVSREPAEHERFTHVPRPWLTAPLHELVYALVERVARENGIEVVFMKGPLLHAQGLREREHSGDVDCWTSAEDAKCLSSALEAWGWKPLRVPFRGTLVSHSITMRGGSWGCEIDIHSRFPGIAAAPDDAFKTVIANTETRSYAGVEVRVPTLPLHAVIASLHLLRPLGGEVDKEDVGDAALMLRTGGPRTVEITRSLDAGYALSAPLGIAFPEEDTSMPEATVPADWAWRSTKSVLASQRQALALLPWRQRLFVAFRLLWPSPELLKTSYDDVGATYGEMTVFRLRRIGTAMKTLFRRR